MRLGRTLRQRQPTGSRTLLQRAISILRRYGSTTNLQLTNVSADTATSTGPVTIADGGGVEVLNNKIWRIV